MRLLLLALWPLSLAFAGFWLFRLWSTGLFRRYVWLSLYLSCMLIQGSVSMFLYYSGIRIGGRSAYTLWWPLSQPILWLLTFGVIFEIFDRFLDGFRGLQKLGRMVVYGSLGLVGGAVVVSLMVDAFTFADLNHWKTFWLKQELSISLVTAGSLFLLFLFQRVFHTVANPNVRLLFVVFGLYHAADTALLLLRTYIGPEFRGVRDVAATSVYAACLLLGWLKFSPAGEIVSLVESAVGDARNELAGHAGAAARRMKSFNDQLETILRA
jgi:hypothetical protein